MDLKSGECFYLPSLFIAGNFVSSDAFKIKLGFASNFRSEENYRWYSWLIAL